MSLHSRLESEDVLVCWGSLLSFPRRRQWLFSQWYSLSDQVSVACLQEECCLSFIRFRNTYPLFAWTHRGMNRFDCNRQSLAQGMSSSWHSCDWIARKCLSSYSLVNERLISFFVSPRKTTMSGKRVSSSQWPLDWPYNHKALLLCLWSSMRYPIISREDIYCLDRKEGHSEANFVTFLCLPSSSTTITMMRPRMKRERYPDKIMKGKQKEGRTVCLIKLCFNYSSNYFNRHSTLIRVLFLLIRSLSSWVKVLLQKNCYLSFSSLDSLIVLTSSAFCNVYFVSDKLATLTVLSQEAPRIEGNALRTRLDVGDHINVTCISTPSKPTATLNWFVNGFPVSISQSNFFIFFAWKRPPKTRPKPFSSLSHILWCTFRCIESFL